MMTRKELVEPGIAKMVSCLRPSFARAFSALCGLTSGIRHLLALERHRSLVAKEKSSDIHDTPSSERLTTYVVCHFLRLLILP